VITLEAFRDTFAQYGVKMPGNKRLGAIQTRAPQRLAGIETGVEALVRVLGNKRGAPPLAGVLGGVGNQGGAE
jgi:hypothetical protein